MKLTRKEFHDAFVIDWCPQCGHPTKMDRINTGLPGILAQRCTECDMNYQANFLEDDGEVTEFPDGWVFPPDGFRTEVVRDRKLLCGCILPQSCIVVGQEWAAADGANHVVRIVANDGEWIKYEWDEGADVKQHEKLAFAFQCRYCLVLPTHVHS